MNTPLVDALPAGVVDLRHQSVWQTWLVPLIPPKLVGMSILIW